MTDENGSPDDVSTKPLPGAVEHGRAEPLAADPGAPTEPPESTEPPVEPTPAPTPTA